MLRRVLVAMVVTIVLLAALVVYWFGSDGRDPSKLEGTWIIVEIDNQTPIQEFNSSPFTITFNPERGTFDGFALCNAVNGEYTTSFMGGFDNTLIGMTALGCVEQEDRFIDLMQHATIFRIQSNRLYIGTMTQPGALIFGKIEPVE